MPERVAFSVLDSLDGGLQGPVSGRAVCSRKGCRADAGWRLLWNNPRIHPPERRKTWVSCREHVEWFEEYLQTRGLWKETLPLAAGTPGAGAPVEGMPGTGPSGTAPQPEGR
ncbi:hypothetical protein [Arthrobacter sp. Br18]|uniref:hypothetical protein n=1 Tax=Arthrobacter sp. Br18 TaxID=1312954 RepID=UPI0004B81624|nr:hypothetical protein [Arthrobacter sp. Br18]